MNSKSTMCITLWCLSIGMILQGCGCTPNERGLHPGIEAVDTSTIIAPLMYWASPRSVLLTPWYSVVAGTIVEVDARDTVPEFAPSQARMCGTVKVDKILFTSPEAKQVMGRAKCIRVSGLSGIAAGDKVVVFIDKYDPIGIVPKSGTNCLIGVKVDSWKDPVVVAVQALHNNQATMESLLTQQDYRRLWESIDPEGLKQFQERYVHNSKE